MVPVSGFLDASHEGSCIHELELLAALYGLRYFDWHTRVVQLPSGAIVLGGRRGPARVQ